MKPAKAILAILAALGATTASATTVVHITGSTAYRGQTNTAILKSFDSGTNVNVGVTNSAFASSGVSYFHGTMGGVDTIVETKFTGSVGGIKAVTSGAALDFLPDNLDTVSGATVVIVAGTSPTIPSTFGPLSSGNPSNGLNPTPAGVNTVPAEVTMSDTYQSATLYRTPVLAGATFTGGREIVGVVPFVWVRSPSATSSVNSAVTNMTPALANLLYGAGSLPASLWSGLASDATSTVYAAGRDPDSGTRLSTFAESGLGANATVIQYHPTATGTDTTATATSTLGSVNAVEIFPTTTVTNLGQTFTGGNAGEASGGTLAGYLGRTFNAGAGTFIGYVGTSDATTAIKTGAEPLTWNGFALTSNHGLDSTISYNFDAIRNGRYTFWGYEHVLYLSGAATDKKAVANKIAGQLFTTDAQILLSSMNVSRPGDGAQVAPR